MKKYLKLTISGLLVVFLVGFLAITFTINKEIVDTGEVDPSKLTFFSETYEESRDNFRQMASSLKSKFKNVEISNLLVKNDMESDLSIDTVFTPAQSSSNKLVIISSGVHGIEGFTGSAVQQYFMSEVLDREVSNNMGVLLIHAINPFGFKYERRVSENNVDMNRNFEVNRNLFARKNKGYMKINQFLNPETEANVGYFRNGIFFIKALSHILKYKIKTLRQSTLQGQYEFEKGIFYGGHDFEPQKKWLERLIALKSRDYESIFLIDIHTGYGKRGKLHFLPSNVEDQGRRILLETMFRDYKIDWPKSENNFYTVSGSFRDYVGALISANKNYTGIAFEFGTLNSQTITGSILSIHNIILENQGYHNGYKNNNVQRLVKKRFREMFFPSSKIWRSEVIKQVSEVLPILLNRFAELNS
jgi:hypothetical protein